MSAAMVWADTYRLEQGKELKPLSAEDKYLLAVAETKKLVNAGQAGAARASFDKLKQDFPEIAGPDLDIFIEAELLFCEGKFTKAVFTYDKLLTDYPESQLREAALDRQFAIGTAFLGGEEKQLLRLFKIKGYAEGIEIMERITERAGIDSPIGLKAATAAAKNYENRKRFDEAYLKWQEISTEWDTGQLGKDTLLNMARCKHAVYTKYPERKRPWYDDSSLLTARSYYERFKLTYPQDAEKIGVDKILKEINEQLADKQLNVAQYYQRTGNKQSANLYYQMLINDTNWQQTRAAKVAKQMLAQNTSGSEKNK
jgi:tetratricopeptide (TPR) repeat protein